MSTCVVVRCGREFEGPGLQCPECREGGTAGTALATASTEVRQALKKSEAEVRLEIRQWAYLAGAVRVIDAEQSYRPDRCKHCGGELGRGNATTRLDRGFPDLIVFWPPPRRVWWVEVKSEAGKQTEFQREFEAACRAAGEIYLLVRSLEEVMEFEKRAGIFPA